MKLLLTILITIGLLGCQGKTTESERVETPGINYERLAHDGVFIDFKFNSNKPTFGDLFLIVGFENPNFPPNSREFESLQHLGVGQVDDYFGIKNENDVGDDVNIWLYPMINGESVFHNEGQFDRIRVEYVVVRNDTTTAETFKNVYQSITENLDVTPVFLGRPIDNYDEVEKMINQTIQYCREELDVEPGSGEALRLDW